MPGSRWTGAQRAAQSLFDGHHARRTFTPLAGTDVPLLGGSTTLAGLSISDATTRQGSAGFSVQDQAARIQAVIDDNQAVDHRLELNDGRVLMRRARSTPRGSRPVRVWAFRDITAEAQATIAELAAQGCVLRTRCDTEVILHAYATWGDDCVRRFNGMWAFVIYDRAARRLFGSRDRFGKKPFFYTTQGGAFVFGPCGFERLGVTHG